MGIEMWLKDDVRNILISANASSAATAQLVPTAEVLTFRRGYQAALIAVGLACGLPPEQLGISRQAVVGDPPLIAACAQSRVIDDEWTPLASSLLARSPEHR